MEFYIFSYYRQEIITIMADHVSQRPAGMSHTAWKNAKNRQRDKLRRSIAARKEEVKSSNPVPTTKWGRNPRKTLSEQIIELLCEDNPDYRVEPAGAMGAGVFYRGEKPVAANKDILVYCDLDRAFAATGDYQGVSHKRKKLSCYLLELKHNGVNWVIDGTDSNRVGTKINHSRSAPNLYMKKILIESKLVVYFRTRREIEPGEQLCYNYYQNVKPSAAELQLFPWMSS